MKKIGLSILLLFALQVGLAQMEGASSVPESTSVVRWKAVAGATFPSVSFKDAPATQKNNLKVGAYAGAGGEVVINEHIGVELLAQYMLLGGDVFSDENTANPFGSQVLNQYSFSYLSFPIRGVYHFMLGTAGCSLDVSLGGYFDILLSSKNVVEKYTSTGTFGDPATYTDVANPIDVGLNAGIAYTFGGRSWLEGVFVSAQYGYGLSNLQLVANDISSNRFFTCGIGYVINH